MRWPGYLRVASLQSACSACGPRWLAFAAASLVLAPAHGADVLLTDGFEDGLGNWRPLSRAHAAIVAEAGTDNRVLQLTPRERDYSWVVLEREPPASGVRMEGRFLFPTEGDGYLGFIYNLQASEERTDFGCIYVKSNGSYIRVSPHYDGNPSWRLYEELKVDLEDERRILTGRWHAFRLDVQGQSAWLYLDDFDTPAAEFAAPPNTVGKLGLEARPGRGEPVWVDDIRVSALPLTDLPIHQPPKPLSKLRNWAYRPAVEAGEVSGVQAPDFPAAGWEPFTSDWRGAGITGRLTQHWTGARDVVWLRASFDAGDKPGPAWLALSTANRMDVWLNGEFRGTAAPEPFIWSDFLSAPQHPGARLPISPRKGRNEFLFRVEGRRFAGGGFFADVINPDEE